MNIITVERVTITWLHICSELVSRHLAQQQLANADSFLGPKEKTEGGACLALALTLCCRATFGAAPTRVRNGWNTERDGKSVPQTQGAKRQCPWV